MSGNRDDAPFWIDPDAPGIDFPDVELALAEPDGLLAIGGDLGMERLLLAYSRGIFPWFGPDQPILWWSPDPRLVLEPARLKISHSLKKTLRKDRFRLSMNRCFDEVVAACSGPRPNQAGTWIGPEMQAAYNELHAAGHAHSVECWLDGKLAGGLYGVSIGRVFFGESMFARVTDASKVAFVALVRQLQRRGFPLIDCQVHTSHLQSLGAYLMPRREFCQILELECRQPVEPGGWRIDEDILRILDDHGQAADRGI